ncbi:MAG: hypothetical protein P9M15_01805 [Candidatus Electryoneaceae bacterium]|nr:hypothetical protein [Candidatus Electryoneaceae bacterium]
MKQMTSQELFVLKVIERHRGRNNPITAKQQTLASATSVRSFGVCG